MNRGGAHQAFITADHEKRDAIVDSFKVYSQPLYSPQSTDVVTTASLLGELMVSRGVQCEWESAQ